MTLSILICTMPKRKAMLDKMFTHLFKQIGKFPVEIIASEDMSITTGAKRNKLISLAKGEYVVFVDDDDAVSDDYIPSIMAALETKPDAVGFKGWITTDGKNKKEWRISRNYMYKEIGGIYFRYNNHLSPMKKSIAVQVPYPDITFGEDFAFATSLNKSRLIRTEVYIDKHLYFYNYISKK